MRFLRGSAARCCDRGRRKAVAAAHLGAPAACQCSSVGSHSPAGGALRQPWFLHFAAGETEAHRGPPPPPREPSELKGLVSERQAMWPPCLQPL